MDKYKINYIFNKDKDINDILIKVLNKELKKYLEMIYKDKEGEALLSCTQFFLDGGKN